MENQIKETKELNKENMTYNKISSNSETSTEIKTIDWYSEKNYYVGHINEAPEFSIDNDYIIRGYRIGFHSCWKSSKSLCMCHNETVNVWSHLIGAFITVMFIIFTYSTLGPYGIKLNSEQHWHIDRAIKNYGLYSEPFYTSKPILHNYRLILSNILHNINKIDNSNENIVNNLFHHIKDYENIYNVLINVFSGDDSIKCFSCIEDFIKNINSIEFLLSEILGKYDNNVLKNLHNITLKIIHHVNKNSVDIRHNFPSIGNYNNKQSTIQLVMWPVFIQSICAFICLLCSSIFHLFQSMGAKMGNLLSRLDYAGISLLVAGSSIPPYYYMFYCDQVSKYVYLTLISLFAIIVFLVTLYPKFHTPPYRRMRGSLFLLLGISTAVPFIHLIFFFDENKGMMDDSQLFFWILGGAVYITGCLIYISRFPERIYRGLFDYVGSSHQIWHVFVFVGITLHHYAAIDTYYDRLNHECPV